MPQEYAEMIAAHPCTENGSSPVTDLKNRRVIPGFVDAHMHPVMLADFRKKITAMPPEINSIEDLTAAIKERREHQAPGEWIEGWGYDEQDFLKNAPPPAMIWTGDAVTLRYPLCVPAHISAVSTVWRLKWPA